MYVAAGQRRDFVSWGWTPPRGPSPKAKRRVQRPHIVAALLADPALLALSDALLVREICSRFAVSRLAAYRGIAEARKKQPVDSRGASHE